MMKIKHRLGKIICSGRYKVYMEAQWGRGGHKATARERQQAGKGSYKPKIL